MRFLLGFIYLEDEGEKEGKEEEEVKTYVML